MHDDERLRLDAAAGISETAHGRDIVLGELTGDGIDTLRSRLTA